MPTIYVFAVIIASILVVAPLLYILLKEHRRRVRRGFFDKNGGEIMKRMNIKTFTEVELKKMTNNYSELIGKGHFGNVFNGIITDNNQQVAVKCPIIDGRKKKNQQNNDDGGEFVDEITFQFKLRHDNLVRLVGCCLETNVPCLVFEFIPNGSLYNVLHSAGNSCMLSLIKRLDIAIGSAEAVSYMHSNGDHNKHVHGDIKSANILLDDDLLPKVSDFGSSRLLSIDMYANAVPADRNYVDPAYVKTGRFTAKSDVYSFGVVLLELITGKTAIYDGNNSLSMNFVRCCKEEVNGRKMYDDNLKNDGSAQSSHVYIECLDKIGELAVRCLKDVDVDERPTMAQVVEELKQIKSMATGGAGLTFR
jgi:serine/threonine protein kinase